jgi:hypothetical protein
MGLLMGFSCIHIGTAPSFVKSWGVEASGREGQPPVAACRNGIQSEATVTHLNTSTPCLGAQVRDRILRILGSQVAVVEVHEERVHLSAEAGASNPAYTRVHERAVFKCKPHFVTMAWR